MSDKPDFAELKRKRDEALREIVRAAAIKMGVDPDKVTFHASGTSGCYCACPDGPCQHVWDGETFEDEDGCMVSATCSLCGEVAAHHDIRVAP